MSEAPGDARTVLLGHIAGAHGVRGWVKIYSFTEPREAILNYQPWLVGELAQAVRIRDGKKQGDRLIALLENVDGREQAERLAGSCIRVQRDQFPDLPGGRYYWADLIGLTVRLENGKSLGTVERMLATGANDVMVVRGQRERLIPFVLGQYVKSVDLDRQVVLVDWDPDF